MSRIAADWDDLVSRADEPVPFLRASFLRAWWRAFGRGRPRLVTVRDPDERLVGGALFGQAWSTLRGVPLRELRLASNVHSNRADLLAAAGQEHDVGVALARWACRARRGWNLLRLEGIPEDSVALRAFRWELARLGFPSGGKPHQRSPWIDLADGWDAFEATLAAKWRSNLRNRRKRMAELGEMVHEVVTEARPDLEARVDECFALEAKGWKGAKGSAIDSRAATRRFYRSVASLAAGEGILRLHTLRVGGKLAAFQLDVEAGGVEYVVKIGYDPAFAKLSPGGLLLSDVLRSASARGVRRVDLLGDEMPWKREWSRRARPHRTLLVFGRGAFGHALHALEFLAVPVVRDAVRGPSVRAHGAREAPP